MSVVILSPLNELQVASDTAIFLHPRLLSKDSTQQLHWGLPKGAQTHTIGRNQASILPCRKCITHYSNTAASNSKPWESPIGVAAPENCLNPQRLHQTLTAIS